MISNFTPISSNLSTFVQPPHNIVGDLLAMFFPRQAYGQRCVEFLLTALRQSTKARGVIEVLVVRGGLKPWFFLAPKRSYFCGIFGSSQLGEIRRNSFLFWAWNTEFKGGWAIGVLELWCFHMHQFQIRSIHGCARGPDVNPLRPTRVRWKMWFGWSTRWGCEFCACKQYD